MTDNETEKKNHQDDILKLLRDNLSRELVFGAILIFFGLLLFFNHILNVDFGIKGLLGVVFFFLGILNHINYLNDDKKIPNLFFGHIYLLLATFFSFSVLPGDLQNLFLYFILFLLATFTIYAYMSRKDLIALIPLAALFGITLIVFIISQSFSVRFRDFAIFLLITSVFIVMYIILRKNIYLSFALISFIISLYSIIRFTDNFIGIMVMWIIIGLTLVYFIKNPDKPIPLFIAAILLLTSFQMVSDSVISIIPASLGGAYWTVGIGCSFLLIWLMRDKFKKSNWTIYPAVILIVIGVFIFLSEIATGETLLAVVLIAVGIALVLRTLRKHQLED